MDRLDGQEFGKNHDLNIDEKDILGRSISS